MRRVRFNTEELKLKDQVKWSVVKYSTVDGKRRKSAPRKGKISFASSPENVPAGIFDWASLRLSGLPRFLPPLLPPCLSWWWCLVAGLMFLSEKCPTDVQINITMEGLALPNVVEKVYTWICLEASQNTFLMMMMLVWFTIGSMLTISALQRRSPTMEKL